MITFWPFCCLLIGILTLIIFAVVSHIRRSKRSKTVAFFHPYCNAGGGGERVLWCAVRAILECQSDCKIVVYTGDTDVSPEKILENAENRFNIPLTNIPNLTEKFEFVFLSYRYLLEDKYYPVFTLLGQAVGGLLVGIEALYRLVPETFIDLMGCPLTLPLFSYVAACRTGCYVHYPMISTDMIQVVKDRTAAFNNRDVVSKSPVLSWAKLIYYRLFAYFYGVAGRAAHVIMVNGSWTRGHIDQLWARPTNTYVVYPPVDTRAFQALDNQSESILRDSRQVQIISIAQFRPEKQHAMQLEAFAILRQLCRDENVQLRLCLIGGCRNEADYNRVSELKKLAKRLEITKHVDFRVNTPFGEFCDELTKSMIGIHTMANEHFGIGVVEFLAAGVIPVAHNSGGPQQDIVVPANKSKHQIVGLLASDAREYAERMLRVIVDMTSDERNAIRDAGRIRAQMFGEERFASSWMQACDKEGLFSS